MSKTEGLHKVGTSDQRMFGPRKVIVCGFPASEQPHFLKVLEEGGMADIPVVFAAAESSGSPMGEIAELPAGTGIDRDSDLERAVILSGITEKELHALLRTYREAGLPAPLWATLTETSVEWPLSQLLRELASEREAFRRSSQA
jgi:hypothetical protein